MIMYAKDHVCKDIPINICFKIYDQISSVRESHKNAYSRNFGAQLIFPIWATEQSYTAGKLVVYFDQARRLLANYESATREGYSCKPNGSIYHETNSTRSLPSN